MKGHRGPLEVPGLGDPIAQAVKVFAEEAKLNYDLWYHDEPVWLVWEEVEKDTFYKQVQIAAFFIDGEGEQLFFIPQAYGYQEEKRKTTRAEPSTPDIYISFRKFHGLSEDNVKDIVRSYLHDAWKKADNFTRNDLTEEV